MHPAARQTHRRALRRGSRSKPRPSSTTRVFPDVRHRPHPSAPQFSSSQAVYSSVLSAETSPAGRRCGCGLGSAVSAPVISGAADCRASCSSFVLYDDYTIAPACPAAWPRAAQLCDERPRLTLATRPSVSGTVLATVKSGTSRRFDYCHGVARERRLWLSASI